MRNSFLRYAAYLLTASIIISTYTCKKDSTGSGNGDNNKPEINVKVNGVDVASGTGTHNFGDVDVSSSSTIITFIIENLGGAVLDLTGSPIVNVTGTDAGNFVVTQQPNVNVAEGDSTEFAMQFTPSSEGNKTASVSISNNDSNEDPYLFNLTGRGNEAAYTATEVAQKIGALLNIPTTSEVILVGPVEPGTKVVEQNLGDVAPQDLQLPNTDGSYYVFLIDNEPDALYGHDMDYGWIEMEGEVVAGNADVYWPGLIERPNATPEPFTVQETIDVNGVQFTYMSGDGFLEGEDNSHKSEPGSLTKPSYDSMNPMREPRKLAFIIDAGERSGSDRLHDMHTKPMSDWVEGEGFQSIHTSQDASNPQPRFTSAARVSALINQAGAYFTGLGEPECGCDEFFFYMTGHGNPTGHTSGIGLVNGRVSELVTFQSIYSAINNSFPDYVKVTLFFDTCFGGRAISEFTATINTLCGKLCALTVITTCKESVSTKAPVNGVVKSGTQKFGAGSTLDHDGDGKVGDIQDRYTEMKDKQGALTSKSKHCPEGGSWCSLDAPPPPEETDKCTGVTHPVPNPGYSYIHVCIKYCNVPEGEYMVDIALSGPSPGTASVPVIDGEACATFVITSYGSYTWTASLNPWGIGSEGSITVGPNNIPCEY